MPQLHDVQRHGPLPGRGFSSFRSRFAVAIAVTGVLLGTTGRGASAQEPAAGMVVIGEVRVEGEARRPESAVLAEAGLTVGDTIAYQDIQQAIKRLWATGNYQDVRVFVEQSVPGQPVAVVLAIEEQPWIAEIRFRGLEHVSAGTVRDTVGLTEGAPLRPVQITRAEAMIRELLARQGFRVRSLESRVEEIPGKPGEHRLVFDVEEGQRVALAELQFRGNQVFGADQLRGVMSTKAEGFFWFRAGRLDEESIRTDLRENLPRFYGENGYIDFTVIRDTLLIDPQSGKARLLIEVDEGAQYRLAEFSVEGNRRFPSEELRRYFERERGGLLSTLGLAGGTAQAQNEVFDAAAFEDATQSVSQLYRNQGYLYAQIEPVVERTALADGTPAVEASWVIREGNPAYINRVSIQGNTFTHENVIRERLLVLPGDVYNEELLIQSYQSLSGLGFFETPLPLPRIEPTETGDVDITFEVKERQTGALNFGTAIGGFGGLSGFLGYSQPNLFGQAKSGNLRWEFGRYSNNFEASYSDPSILQSRISGSASLFSARDRFFRSAEGQRRRTGGSLRFGFPLPNDRWSRLYVGYALSRTSYEQFDNDRASSVFALPPGLQSTVSVGVVRNTLNHPLFPTQGTRQEIEAELSGGPLGGDGDFQKYSVGSTWYVPVGQIGGGDPGSRPIRFTLGFTAEGGTLFGDASRFPFERFSMGGVQFGRPLRGYEETTITPRGYFPRNTGIAFGDRLGNAFVRLSAEYAVRVNDNLSLSTFYDAGNIWQSAAQVNPSRLFRGAGVGVTLQTPFGPLGVDWAYGFDKTEPGWQLHFKLGPVF